jgi:hypothetical protein
MFELRQQYGLQLKIKRNTSTERIHQRKNWWFFYLSKYHFQGIDAALCHDSFTKKNMGTELIAAWVYKKGELAKKKLDNWLVGIAAIISIAFTFIIALPILKTNIPFTGKISNFLLLLTWLASFGLLYYILKLFSGSIFMLYQKIAGIKEEEILFTDSKIKSTNKTWVINDDIKKIASVDFSTSKNSELVFKGTSAKPGKSPVRYTITIPVPVGELRNAEKVYQYFKAKLS